MNESSEAESIVYSATDISLILGGVAAAFATIVYSLKHVKNSSCLCFKCTQEVGEDQPHEHVEPEQLNHDEHNPHIDQIMDLLKYNIISNSEV